MDHQQGFQPPRWLIETFERLSGHVNNHIKQIQLNMQQPCRELRAHASGLIQELQANFERQLRAPSPLQPLMAVCRDVATRSCISAHIHSNYHHLTKNSPSLFFLTAVIISTCFCKFRQLLTAQSSV